MSEIGFAWIVPQPSAWQRGVRVAGCVLTTAVGAALVARWVAFAPLAATAAALLLAALLSRAALRAREPAMRVCVDGHGQCWLEVGGRCLAARCGFVSPLLIVVQAERYALPVWRDAVPHSVFRRLSATARWHVARGGNRAAPKRIGQV